MPHNEESEMTLPEKIARWAKWRAEIVQIACDALKIEQNKEVIQAWLEVARSLETEADFEVPEKYQ